MRPASTRWAVSLADLSLLLLAFFVLLHARGNDGEDIVYGVRSALGGAKGDGPAAALDEPAAPLFETGEAVLTPSARKRLAAVGARAAGAHARVAIDSSGTDAGTVRLDRWELAAARAAAIARAVKAGGLEDRMITVSVINATAGDDDSGQRVRIRQRPHKSGTLVASTGETIVE